MKKINKLLKLTTIIHLEFIAFSELWLFISMTRLCFAQKRICQRRRIRIAYWQRQLSCHGVEWVVARRITTRGDIFVIDTNQQTLLFIWRLGHSRGSHTHSYTLVVLSRIFFCYYIFFISFKIESEFVYLKYTIKTKLE